MANNSGYQTGSDEFARTRDIGTFLGSPLKMPITEALTSIPTVVSFVNQAVTTAAALTSIGSGATHALVTVDTGGGDLRFREDGNNPTTSTGLLVVAGSAVEFTNLSNIRVIATTGTVNINISYRRYDQ